MPKKLEEKLKRKAKKKHLSKKRAGAFIYGAMRKTGWKPDRELNPPSHVIQKNY